MKAYRLLTLKPGGLAAMLALVTFAGCGKNQSAHDQAAATPARVTVVKPQRKTISRTITQPGQIEAFDQARLYAKIPAYVERYLVDIGDKVQGPRFDASGNLIARGQLLAELSAPELEQDLQQKKALVAQSNADVEQAQAAIKVTQAESRKSESQLNEANAAAERFAAEYDRWNSEYNRVAQLVSRSAVTQKLADETKAQMLAADAARKEAEAHIESAKSAVVANQAQVEKSMADEAAIRARRQVAEADESRAAALLNYLKIEAPFDATVSQRNADIGFFAQAGGGNETHPLFTLVRIDPVRVFVDVPEMEAPLVDVGDAAVVRLQSLADHDFKGSVTRTAWALDDATRTLHTEIDIPNADGLLRPGMYSQVTIVLDERQNTCTVPLAAITQQDGRAWCFTIDAGKAVRKQVTLGLKSGDDVEITSGLGDNELVILGKAGEIKNGQPVESTASPASP